MTKMHDNEVTTSVALVARLLQTQFPQWAGLPLRPVASAGTDNALYRLGDDMVVRLPRIDWAVGMVDKEQRWLPRLAPRLPLAVPLPLACGAPGEGYPWDWSVYRWLEGDNTPAEALADAEQAALDLAGFIGALQRIDAAGGPPPGPNNSWRGEPLARRDERTRRAIGELGERIDAAAAIAVWEEALTAPMWRGAPVWLHGDLQAGNLLFVRGRLSAVIDWGCLGVGDPACDVMAAWLYLTAAMRPVFRTALGVDDAAWARARGWALSVSLIALPYYWTTNPTLAAIARRAIVEVVGAP